MKPMNFKFMLTICLFAFAYCNKQHKPLNAYKNILFVVADDLGWSDLGYENDNVYTPNIDSLAREGVILNQSYAYPLCTPSRSSFLSGVYAERTGLQHDVILPEQGIGLPTKFTILPEVLRQFGYTTHGVGKWHLGFCNANYTPVNRGFDTFYGYFNAQNDYYTHRVKSNLIIGSFDGLDFWNQTSDYSVPILDKNNTYSMFTYTQRAIDILEHHNKDEPFFMYFASQNCHAPIEVPKKYEDIYKNITDPNRRKYLGMVSVLDEAVGNLTQALQRLDLLDDTIIFFTSDNGGAVYASGRNYPLRGGKMTVFEGGTRVKGFIYGKDLKPYVNDGMFHAVDWMPTILHAAVGTPVEVTGIDGVDHWPSITQNLPSERTSFIYNVDPLGNVGCFFTPTEAIRDGDWKLIRGCPGIFTDWYPLPTYDEKFNANLDIERRNMDFSKHQKSNYTSSTHFLYNVKNDPLEKENLAENYPELVQQLGAKLDEFKKNTVRPLNPPTLLPNRRANPKYWGDKWSPGWC